MLNPLLPEAVPLRCRHIRIQPDLVTVVVETTGPKAACPICGQPSRRLHSRYTRTLGDLPWQGRVVRWSLVARKFFCDRAGCPRQIFTERLPEVTAPYARKTGRLEHALTELAFACGGEPGARLAWQLGMPVSADTLLRRIRRSSAPTQSVLRVLGVDDWAVRRGQRYGTILCDLEQHRPIDLLNDREAETLAAWLRGHPEIRLITRDRASFYIEGASKGAPQAVQVADRFHLMQNLRQALVRMLEHRYRHVAAVARHVSEARRSAVHPPSVVEPPKRSRTHRLPRGPTMRDIRRARRLERYQQVIELHRQGVSQRAIAKRVGVNRETVGRYIHAGRFPERTPRKYASRTDPFTDYLHKRWKEGCHNAAQLARELETQGFVGSYCSVRRRVAHWDPAESSRFQGSVSPVPPAVHPPSSRRLAWLLLKESGDLDDQDRVFVEALCQRCPEVAVAAKLAREFGDMAHDRQGHALDDWIQRAWDRAIPRELRAFATGLRSDYDAVKAAMTTDWSNGQVEGQVNRLKLIKRQMYGRAKFDLLRQRVLHMG
jgi:transposase